MITETTPNVQARQRRTPVRCRRCGKTLTAAGSIAVGAGPDCEAIEASGNVPIGREWTLRPGDWVTCDIDDRPRLGEIVGRDGFDDKRYRVEFDDAGEPGKIVSVFRRWLTFAGVERPIGDGNGQVTA